MKGTAKRAKIMLPKSIRAPSVSPKKTTRATPMNPAPVGSKSDKSTASRKPVFSSTLKDAPVMPPNDTKLVFESEFSTIREDTKYISEREIPTINEAKSNLETSAHFQAAIPPQNPKPPQETKNPAINCKAVQKHKTGCSACSKSKSNEISGSENAPKQLQKGEPFCSSFREDIANAPEELEFGFDNSISMVAGPSTRRYHTRSSVASSTGRNPLMMTTLPELDETNNLFGVGHPEEEIIQTHDSASQHEFRYYDGIRQRYCSSFKGNGFDVPGIIRLPFDTNTSMSTILNSVDEHLASDSFESNEETLQNISETIDDSAVSTRTSISSPSKPLNHGKEPFCSSFRPSLSHQPSHMTFNQKNAGPPLPPLKLLAVASDEDDEESTVKESEEADGKDYVTSDSEDSEEEDEAVDQKCIWMEAHLLCCFVCKTVDSSKVEKGFRDSESKNGSKKKSFNCPKCEKKFAQKSSLNRHFLLIHELHRPHTCSECNKSFGLKEHLNKHVLTVHEGKKPFSCSACKKRFGQKSALKTHMLTVHEKQKLYFCLQCEKSFGVKKTLDTHISTVHEMKRPHKCLKCEQSFGEKRTLTVHLRIHDGVKPHVCSECSKSFTQKSNLTTHLLIHDGVKPYSCSECSKLFSQKGSLTVHMRIHRNEKPFKCNTYEKSFSVKCNLRQHEKTHNADDAPKDSDSE